MTCIIGMKEPNGIWLGADSAGSDGTFVESRADPKVFTHVNERKETIGFAFCGCYRTGQVIQYQLKIPKKLANQTDHSYLAVNVSNSIRVALRMAGILKKTDELESSEGTFIITYRNTLYRLESDFHIAQPIGAYTADGSGRDFALGALHATSVGTLQKQYKKRMVLALQAAGCYCTAVAPPYHLLFIPKKENGRLRSIIIP